ncbi:MAG: hypothetical protein ACXAEE_08800 [Candidatus Thorarchaeota archaeon]|jgi:hypothetical protein
MQEMDHYQWETFEEKEEETIEEVGFWTNLLTTFLTLSWMATIFFFCCVSGAAPTLHIDVGAQMAPYLWASGSLTSIWLMNKIYSNMTERRDINR